MFQFMAMARRTLRSRPLQARSRDAVRRVLAATEQLLSTTHFEHLTVRRILRAAGVSAGSFYARFRSKEDLLPLLYAAYSRDLAGRMSAWLAPDAWRGAGLAQRIGRLTRLAVTNYRERRGLLRTVALLARSRPGRLARPARLERTDQYRSAERLLLACSGEIHHPDPSLAVRVGLLFTLATCRERILFTDAPHPASVRISDVRLARELARALHAYLVTPHHPADLEEHTPCSHSPRS